MKSTRSTLVSLLVALLCAATALPPSYAMASGSPQAASPSSDEQTRKELMTFFTNAARLAPTALGKVPQDAAALAELRQKIDALGPEELASVKTALSAVPDWQNAPEALSSAFQMQVLGEEAARRATDLDAFRAEVSEFYAAARLLPDDALKSLKLDAATVAEMQARIHAMPDQSLALLQLEMDQQGDWRGLKANLLSSLSPEARSGLRAFANHGPLEQKSLEDLGTFRKDLEEFIANLNALPPHLAGRFASRSVAGLASKLDRATPEALFMIRQRIDTPELRQAMTDARLLARAGKLSAQERADLDRFRADLAALYGGLVDFAPADASGGTLAQRVAALSPEETLLARDRVESIPSWNRTLPVIFGAVSTPEQRKRFALVEQDTDPAARRSLEMFRDATLDRLAALPIGPGVDATALAEAVRSVEEATPRDLFLMHGAASLLSGADEILELLEIPRAVSKLARLSSAVSFNCPCIDIVIACVPVQGLCNILAAPINLALAGLEAVVAGLQTAVNAVSGVIDDVLGFVVQIGQDILNLPNVLLNALQTLFTNIANAILGEFSPENIAEKLGLVEGFWSSIPVLPQIPCPPDGFNLHPFGEVGDDLTASKYERYLFVFDTLIDLIPDTEISLALKIPAQLLYGGVQYLGICLRDAAMARSESATAAFRTMVSTKLDLALENQGSAQTGINAIQSQVGFVQTQVAELSVDLLAFQDMDLRLAIEASLASEGNKNIASFLLPEAFGGALELVREIVSESIQAAIDAGFDVKNAEMVLSWGDARFAAGDYAGAYDRYASAYRDAAKGDLPGMDDLDLHDRDDHDD